MEGILGLGIYERNIYTRQLETAKPGKERTKVLFVLVKAFHLASDGNPVALVSRPLQGGISGGMPILKAILL